MGKFEGNTSIGRTANKLISKDTGARQGRNPAPAIGRIIDVRQYEGEEVYEVKLKWVDGTSQNRGTSSWIPMDEPVESISFRYGSPRDLKSHGHYCKVDYRGISNTRGFARIISDPFYDKQDIAAWNGLEIRGAAYAPPGKGMI